MSKTDKIWLWNDWDETQIASQNYNILVRYIQKNYFEAKDKIIINRIDENTVFVCSGSLKNEIGVLKVIEVI